MHGGLLGLAVCDIMHLSKGAVRILSVNGL